MLIWIGKYPTYISPYRFLRVVLFPLKPFMDDEKWDDMVMNLADKVPEKPFLWVTKTFLNNGQRRKIIRIHRQDLWNIDVTLAPIILELLKRHKETSNGYFMVDDEDVPQNLRFENPTFDGTNDGEYSTETYRLRRDYVLDEMIYAFEQIIHPDREQKFELEDGKAFDFDAHIQHEKRIRRGTTLFGKYLMNLWD